MYHHPRLQSEVSLEDLIDMTEDRDADLKDRIYSALMARNEIDPVTGCMVYTGAWNADGGARVRVQHRVYHIARVGAWLFMGYDLWDDVIAIHTCECLACFNPEHLAVAPTMREAKLLLKRIQATADRARRRQFAADERNAIHELAAAGMSAAELARENLIPIGQATELLAGRDNCRVFDVQTSRRSA